MTGTPSHLRIALDSIRCFTDDGRLDLNELNYLLGIATADGNVNADEKRVLASLFKQASGKLESPQVLARIREVKKLHGID